MEQSSKPVEPIWEDREVRFDSKAQLLACRRGEKVIDSINSVEDTKGNNGERGSLIVTNLRILWVCHSNSRINLSIGLNTVLSINIRKAKSKLRGQTQVCLHAFIFVPLTKSILYFIFRHCAFWQNIIHVSSSCLLLSLRILRVSSPQHKPSCEHMRRQSFIAISNYAGPLLKMGTSYSYPENKFTTRFQVFGIFPLTRVTSVLFF